MEKMSKTETLEELSPLAEMRAIVADGDWMERFVDRLMDEDDDVAHKAALEAIQDGEVILPAIVVIALCLTDGINRAAAATAFKVVWLDSGIVLPPDLLRDAVEALQSARTFLMDIESQEIFDRLGDDVTVYRGQFFEAGKAPNGASWTLSEEVAQWYSAPAPAVGLKKRGWVLKAIVPKSAILTVLCDRGENEVVLDLDCINKSRLTAKRGTCDHFPKHLSGSKLGFAGVLTKFL